MLAEMLSGMVEDVDRALREELEIFPVCHHSSSSALAMALRLRSKRSKIIYLELCEDFQPLLGELRNCRLPRGAAGVRLRAARLPAALGAG